jgi:predicted secreted protein
MSNKRRLCVVLTIAACLYAVAFFGTRARITMTTAESPRRTIVFYYFSKTPVINRMLYGLFYPVIVMHGYKFDAQGNIPRNDVAGPYYVASVEELAGYLDE